MAAALANETPGILTILIWSSFLVVLNVMNFLLDKVIYCGLVGQIFVGVTWGKPGGNLLEDEAEKIIVLLGYLGLILLVYEGGLSTSFSAVKSNLVLSLAVALTGICLPIAFSFSLSALAYASPLQAFAAGAALCSTSLGTTFTVLSTSELTTTRLGTVLTTAAMLDDVVGLIMVQVISSIGSNASSFSSITVVRPVAVSVGLVIILLLACRFVVRPATHWLNGRRKTYEKGPLQRVSSHKQTSLVIHTSILVAMVSGASCAGTSDLFAAYLAGASISWWDSDVQHPSQTPNDALVSPITDTTSGDKEEEPAGPAVAARAEAPVKNVGEEPKPETDNGRQPVSMDQRLATQDPADTSGTAIFEEYYKPAMEKILKPFFFASIGFSVPITRMFSGFVVWRGLVYTVLMLLGKAFTGLWLVRFQSPSLVVPSSWRALSLPQIRCWGPQRARQGTSTSDATQCGTMSGPGTQNEANNRTADATHPKHRKMLPKPRSLYPASILGAAMVSRGEIGFLIASLAESKDTFKSSSSKTATSGDEASEIFLIVIWATTLCTIIGPLSVGTLVRRVRKLQRQQQDTNTTNEPLGVWGIGLKSST